VNVAVVGSGVSGLTAAYALSRHHSVTLYERDTRFGGHSNTVGVAGARGEVGVDTGFIVHNRATYPRLVRLFEELGVDTQPSDMSFGVRCDGCGLEYAGARGARGVAAQPMRLARPRHLRMLAEVLRFHRQARQLLRGPTGYELTLGKFLDRGGYSQYTRRHFVLPLTGAIWSAEAGSMHQFPARYLVRFFANHGMLTVKHSPSWRTVTGGSRTYVRRILDRLGDDLHLDAAVVSVRRRDQSVIVTDTRHGDRQFDKVVIATHADQALALLADPTAIERELLSRFRYSANETVLHTDSSLLPRTPSARASWNYLLPHCEADVSGVRVTYHMNRLQALQEPVDYCVTLNQRSRIPRHAELRRFSYEHPIYTLEALEAQRRLPSISGVSNTAFCGAYHGWGFHEDGCVSGIRAALALGCSW
jgi:predicted NAD/FAD-binding protein